MDTLTTPEPYTIDSLNNPNPVPQGDGGRKLLGYSRKMDLLSDWEGMLGDDFEAVARKRGFHDRYAAVTAQGLVGEDLLKAKVRRDLFVQDVTRATPEEIRTGFPQARVAKGLFGLEKADHASFDAAMVGYVGDKVDTRNQTEEVSKQAMALAIQGKALTEVLTSTKTGREKKWKELEPAARAAHAAIRSEFSEQELETGRALFETLAGIEGVEVEKVAEGATIPFTQYARMDQAGRDKVMGLLAMQAEAEGEDVGNYFKRLAAAMGGGTRMISGGLLSRDLQFDVEGLELALKRGKTFDENQAFTEGTVIELAAKYGRSHLDKPEAEDGGGSGFGKTRELTDEEKKLLTEAVALRKGQAAFVQDVQTAGVKAKRYLDDKREGFWDTVGDYTVMAAESLPVMAAAAAPYGTGLPLVANSYAERNKSTLRREHPEMDEEMRNRLAWTSGVLEAGVDRVQWLTLGAKVPKLNAAMLKAGKVGVIGVGATRALGVGLAETGQEVVQDLMLPMVQTVASALSEDIPGVDWQKALLEEYEALGDIFGVSMVFGIIGAGGSVTVDYFHADKIKETLRDKQGLALAGFEKETVEAIAETAEKSPAAAAELLKAAVIETPAEVRRENAELEAEMLEREAAEIENDKHRANLPELEKAEDGTLTVVYPDGSRDESMNEADAMAAMATWEMDESASMSEANRELAAFMEESHEGNPELAAKFKFTGRKRTLKSWAGASSKKLEQARARVRILLRQEGFDDSKLADHELPLGDYSILGSSKNFGGKATRIAMEINKGAHVGTVVEEHAEGVAKWAMESGMMSREEIIENIRKTEKATGKVTLAADLESLSDEALDQEVAEAFSRLAVANFFGKAPEVSGLSAKFKSLLRAFKEAFTAILELAAGIREIQKAGLMDENFEELLDIAGGVSMEYRKANLDRQMEREMMEMLEETTATTKEILRGRLPHPETLKARNSPEAAQVAEIYESMREDDSLGASKAARTRKVNEYFLPVGEWVGLDEVRGDIEQDGFNFATSDEMLDALLDEVGFGIATRAITSSFSIGRAEVTPEAGTRSFPTKGGGVIGPATFSIRAHHGTPHKVDRFTTEKIGTGEGAQAYGWGLYFAADQKVADYYRKSLSAGLVVDNQAFDPAVDKVSARDPRSVAMNYLASTRGDATKALEKLKAQQEKTRIPEVLAEVQELIEDWQARDVISFGVGGNLYTVNVKVEEDELLDWDKNIDDQPERIRLLLLDWRKHAGESFHTGQQAYEAIATDNLRKRGEGSDHNKHAAESLLLMGIKGIRFLDGNSRSQGEGSYNYVIFDGADIEILEENGKPVAIAASFSITRADSPLLAAIEALTKAPERKAETYGRMKAKVVEVRKRWEKRKHSRGFAEEDFDDQRFDQLRDIATLEAMARALPPSIRGKVIGSFRALENLKTAKARENYLTRLMPKVENALERHLSELYREAIRSVMAKGSPKVSESRTRGGKIGAMGHAIFAEAKRAMVLTPSEAEARAEELTARIEGADEMTFDELDEADGLRAAVELFHDYENADSARLEQGLKFLNEVYGEGRMKWLEVLSGRKQVRTDRVETIIRGIGYEPGRKARVAAKRADEGLLKSFDEGMMAQGLSGSQTIRRLAEASKDPVVKATVEEMEKDFHDAESREMEMNLADQEAFGAALKKILGVSTEYALTKRLRELATNEKQEDIPVTIIEGRKLAEVSVPIKYAQALLDGEISGYDTNNGRVELNLAQMKELEVQMERLEELPDKERNAKQVLKLVTTEATGKRNTLGAWTQLEALGLYLTMRQPDQRAKLERMGYDGQTWEELEKFLAPELIELGTWMTDYLEAEQGVMDALHRSEKGVGLGLVEFYFPVRNDVSRADNTGASLDGNQPQQTGRSVSSIKERVTNSAPPAPVDALAVFLAHRSQVNFWKSHVTPLREWGGVIKDERFSTAVKATMGEKYYSALTQRLARIESGGRLKAGQMLAFDRFMKGVMRRFALGTLGMRLSTLMVNVSAGLNVGMEIPAKDLVKGVLAALKRPEAFKDAWNSPAIRRRLEGGATFEAQIAQSSGPSKRALVAQLDHWAEKGVAPINYIDTGANLFGAAAIYEYTRTQAKRANLDDEAAKLAADEAVDRFFLRAAQPSSKLGRSELELAALDNPLSALFALFASEPRKNLAISYLAARELITGKGTQGKEMAVQTLAVATLGMVATEFAIRSLYSAMAKADEDDEEGVFNRWWSRLTDGKAWAHRMAVGHLTGIPVLGQTWEYFAGSIVNEIDMIPGEDVMVFNSSPNPLMRTVGQGGKALDLVTGSSDAVAEDTIDVVQAMGSAVPGGALFAQLANVADAGHGIIQSNYSKPAQLERAAGRYREFSRSLGLVKDMDAVQQSERVEVLADWLRSHLSALPEEDRAKVLETLKPSRAILEAAGMSQ